MKLMARYLTREIAGGIMAVLLGFLGLFAFFDLINELDDIGQGGYRLPQAVLYVLLGLPSHIYELMPASTRWPSLPRTPNSPPCVRPE